jgi:hypothetical protein
MEEHYIDKIHRMIRESPAERMTLYKFQHSIRSNMYIDCIQTIRDIVFENKKEISLEDMADVVVYAAKYINDLGYDLENLVTKRMDKSR